MALDPGAVENYSEFQMDFNIGIELEVAYNPSTNTVLDCFVEESDETITSEVEGAELAEFVLDYGFRKYFQHKEEIDKEISKILFMSYTNDGSCGTHVHISHPSIKNGQNEDFLIYLDYYWVYYSQDKIKMKYPQVRHYSKYAKDNKGWLEGDQDDRDIQMNIQNAFIDQDDLAHVEFRGYDGLPNGELSTFRARIQTKMLSFYIEDLCDEYTKAYFSFKQGIPCIPIETLNEITATKVVEIMDMYYGDTKPPWDGKYQLDKIEILMHYIGLDTTSQDILSAYKYYDSEEERTITHKKPLIIKLLKYFTKWCGDPELVVEFLRLVPNEVWVKNLKNINQVIRRARIYPNRMVVDKFLATKNDVSTREMGAESKGRRRSRLHVDTASSSASGTSRGRLRARSIGRAGSVPKSPDYVPTAPVFSPEYMQGEGAAAGSAGGGAAAAFPEDVDTASSSAPPARRRRRGALTPRRDRSRVDGEDPLRDLRLRF